MTGEEATKRRRYNPLVQLVLARIREFVRHPEAVFWVYAFPLIMMVALGIAFRSRSVEQFDVDIVGEETSESLSGALHEDARFDVHSNSESTAQNRLRTGKTDVVIVLGEATDPRHDYYFDPTRPSSLVARDSARDVLQTAAGRRDVIASVNHEMTDVGGRYIDFLVPGLIGMGLMGGGLWGVGFAIVDLRIRKLLKRYLATPMNRGHFLAAMMISRLLFTVSECLLLLVFARVAFSVMNHGSYLAVTFLVVLGAFEFAGIGLLVASRAQTLESVSGLMNLVMLPMWIASGVFYSIERFPAAIQPVLGLLPLTPLIDALRAVMQEGRTLASLGVEVSTCLVWGIVSFALALRWFRWS